MKRKRIERQTAAGTITLTAADKMPGYSWSIPAGDSCPAAKLTVKQYGDCATCASCYAKGGNYTRPAVKAAQQRRFTWLRNLIGQGRSAEAVDTLVSMIAEGAESGFDQFRIHDSGDLFSPAYIRVWTEIAKRLPRVRFWCPTREYLRPAQLEALQAFAALPNVTVKPSAPCNNMAAPVVPGLAPGSTVVTDPEQLPAGYRICPATAGAKSCEAAGCDSCWRKDSEPVAYLVHGSLAARARKAARRLPVA